MTRNGSVQEQTLEKQMGCMAGFFQIFDRSQILAGKRLYSAKRLPHSSAMNSPPESEKSIGSPAVVRGLNAGSAPSPEPPRSPAPEKEIPPRSPLPLPLLEFKEGTRSSWKFAREAPRLSLDSRATFDAKGGLHPREIRTNAVILSAAENAAAGEDDDDGETNRRSPSVVARLMGLEPIRSSDPEPTSKAVLRRSASESRVNRDLYPYRFIDGNASLQTKQSQSHVNVIRNNNAAKSNQDRAMNHRPLDPKSFVKSEPSNKAQNRRLRKSYFDSADFFPEPPKQTSTTVYEEVERRLKVRGIDEPSKDLETLKQILEALQLKGLLHPRNGASQIDYRNFVYGGFSHHHDSPIIVMRPTPAPTSRSPRLGYESPPPPSSHFRSPRLGPQRNSNFSGESLQAVSPSRDRNSRSQSPKRTAQIQPGRTESCVKSPIRRRPSNIETQRKRNDVVAEQRRLSPVNSPKLNSRKSMVSDQRPPRNRKSTVEICRSKEPKILHPVEDESFTMSESTSADTERAKVEEYKEGKSLLERCDKLLHSIAEITAAELQPSPVSVLDSSFYKDESSTSPIMKRGIEFKDQLVELEEDIWEPVLSSPIKSELNGGSSKDCDLIYISEIIGVSNYLSEHADVFELLEKKIYHKRDDTSKVDKLKRRLIFDTIIDILNRNRQLPPWKVVSGFKSLTGQALLRQVWSEFRRIRERDESDDLFEVICGVLRKDLAGDAIHGWGDCPLEVSEAVLDIERLIFKDLIGETIRDLAGFSSTKCYNKPLPSCRKLVF